MAKVAKFTAMADSTKEDYDLLEELEAEYIKELPERLLEEIEKFTSWLSG